MVPFFFGESFLLRSGVLLALDALRHLPVRDERALGLGLLPVVLQELGQLGSGHDGAGAEAGLDLVHRKCVKES